MNRKEEVNNKRSGKLYSNFKYIKICDVLHQLSHLCCCIFLRIKLFGLIFFVSTYLMQWMLEDQLLPWQSQTYQLIQLLLYERPILKEKHRKKNTEEKKQEQEQKEENKYKFAMIVDTEIKKKNKSNLTYND